MKLKENIITALLLAIGFILHRITPGIFGGMKFDFLLIFIFISVFINSSKENIVLTSLLGGLISAMTTDFPGGQLPNMIDKIVLGLVLFLVMQASKDRLNLFTTGLIGLIGTLVSGSVFLASARLLTGVELELLSMIKAVVIPAALINMLGTAFVYKIVEKSLRLSKIRA